MKETKGSFCICKSDLNYGCKQQHKLHKINRVDKQRFKGNLFLGKIPQNSVDLKRKKTAIGYTSLLPVAWPLDNYVTGIFRCTQVCWRYTKEDLFHCMMTAVFANNPTSLEIWHVHLTTM